MDNKTTLNINFNKSLFITLTIRLLSVLLPLIMIKLIGIKNSYYAPLTIKLLGLGVYLHCLLSTDFHRLFYFNFISSNTVNVSYLNREKKLKFQNFHGVKLVYQSVMI